jgi:hypothetical protein
MLFAAGHESADGTSLRFERWAMTTALNPETEIGSIN